MIAMFDKDDNDMLCAKTGSWWSDNPQRGMANNSILTSFADQLKYPEIKSKLSTIKQFGEPGFVNMPDYDWGVNPCGEISLLPVIYCQVRGHFGEDAYKQTGFAFCNLVEINAEPIEDEEMFLKACDAASFIATVQALYTNFKYIGGVSEIIAERDRNIGVSITGIYANPLLRGEVLRHGAKRVVHTNEFWADKLGINPSRTCTTIKPSGNASSILALSCSGIHPAHDRKYLRRIRIKTNSPEYIALKDTPLVKLLTSGNDEAVISFPINVDSDRVTFKDDVDAVDHLSFIAHVKHFWVNKGSAVKGVQHHNVSATVEVKDTEWDEAAAVVYSHGYLFTGISFLPKLGDQVYDNAPFQRLSTPELEAEYQAAEDYLREHYVDFIDIMSNRENIESGDMAAQGCAGGACEIR